MANEKPDAKGPFNLATVAVPAALELGIHILVHYTIQGAAIAMGIAAFLSPAMGLIGLSTTFAAASGATATTAAAAATPALPSLF